MSSYRFRIHELLAARGLTTNYSVQRALNVGASQATRLLDSNRQTISLKMVDELTEFFGCQPGDLFAPAKDGASTGTSKKNRRAK
jgi:DNA-binding Xre family transcriptional regulator